MLFVSICFQALKGWILEKDNWGPVGQFPTPGVLERASPKAMRLCSLTMNVEPTPPHLTQQEQSSWPLVNWVISYSISPSSDDLSTKSAHT